MRLQHANQVLNKIKPYLSHLGMQYCFFHLLKKTLTIHATLSHDFVIVLAAAAGQALPA